MSLVVGFTGGRRKRGHQVPSTKQVEWLIKRLAELHPAVLHHGGCRDSDAAAHRVARALGVAVVIHPNVDTRDAYIPQDWVEDPGVTILCAKKPLVRNKDIVDVCRILLATPGSAEHLRSGTWSAVRYALKTHTPREICLPDGSLDPRSNNRPDDAGPAADPHLRALF